jgi:hypothetical protein
MVAESADKKQEGTGVLRLGHDASDRHQQWPDMAWTGR